MAENFLINANLVSYWMFEDAATPSLDGTANDNDLTWVNTPTRSSTHHQGSFAIQLTGSAQLSRAIGSLSSGFPGTDTGATGFSFGGWMYISTYGGATDQTFNRLDGMATGGWALNIGGATQGDVINFDGTGGAIYMDGTLSATTWHLIVLRYNGANRSGAGANDEQSLWIDNVKQSTTFAPANWAAATVNPLQWLAQSGTYLYDEWFAFNYALLDTQIADIYTSGLAGSAEPAPETRTIVMVRGG